MMQRSAPIVLFVIYGCPYCKAAKKLCAQMGLPHKAINIGNNANLMTRLAQETGSPTVPKVFVQGRFIGGFDQLNQLVQNGKIWSALQQPMV